MDRSTRECAELRKKLAEAVSQSVSLKRELDYSKKDLVRSQVNLTLLQRRNRTLEDALQRTQQQLRERERELDVKISSRPQQESRKRASHSQQSHPEKYDKVLSANQLELRCIDSFFTKTDNGWSGADVVQMLQDLNWEVLQFAASAAEACTAGAQSKPIAAKALSVPEGVVARRLGPAFARLLSTKNHTLDPTVVQLALQASLSALLAKTLSSFCVGFSTQYEVPIWKIFSQMHQSEPQATSSRWRALTHHHIRALNPRIDEQAMHDIVEASLCWSTDVFRNVGWGKHKIAYDALRSGFAAQLTRIAQATCKLALTIREDIMSTHFQVLHVPLHRTFDPEWMSTAFDAVGHEAFGDAVLCTAEMGLGSSTHRRRNGDEGQRDIQWVTLLKPKVVLEKGLEDLANDADD